MAAAETSKDDFSYLTIATSLMNLTTPLGFGLGISVELRDAFFNIGPKKSAKKMCWNIMTCASFGFLTGALWPISIPLLCLYGK